MARVTGLGGVFYKCEDVERTKRWYAEILGISGDYGGLFPHGSDTPDGYSLLSPFKATTDYLDPSPAQFMINLRVDDLDGFLAQLESKDIEVLGRQDEPYGKFAWILDCDGIKVELWEQVGPAPAV